MVSIATMGKFLPALYMGGAMKYQQPPEEKKRLKINITSISSVDRKPSPLKIILRCSDNLGV